MGKDLKTTIKDIWGQTGKWLRSQKLFNSGNSRPEVDDEGLITQDPESTQATDAQAEPSAEQSENLVVQAVPQVDKSESIEKLQQGVTEKLAAAYTETGQGSKAAREMLTLAAASGDVTYKRNMMLQAAETYDKANNKTKAVTTYKDYLKKYPRPVSHAIEAQLYLADYYQDTNQSGNRSYWLNQIIRSDRTSGKQRSDRTRYLAASATLELAAPARNAYQRAKLTVPLKRSLKKKKSLMQKTIKLYDQAIKYNVSDITTAATFQLAEVYNDFARSLMKSQRPKKLSAEELEQYEILLEEQAFPFEEKAIDIHVANLNRTREGLYDKWIKKSHEVLAKLQPVRYAKNEKTVSYVEASN